MLERNHCSWLDCDMKGTTAAGGIMTGREPLQLVELRQERNHCIWLNYDRKGTTAVG